MMQHIIKRLLPLGGGKVGRIVTGVREFVPSLFMQLIYRHYGLCRRFIAGFIPEKQLHKPKTTSQC